MTGNLLQAAGSMRFWNIGGRGGKRKQSSQKGGKRKKLSTWTHTFVCLANTTQDEVPDSDERASLQLAGLGEKRITLCSFSNFSDIHAELTFQFPKLNHSNSGFELLKVQEGGGKVLGVIACPNNGYTVSYLRAVVHHAKIYIRPVQKNLSLDPEMEEV